MPPPAELPTWTTTLANRLKPLAGAIASGFVAGERPPPRWVNWLLGMLCDWVAWLDQFTGELDTRVLNNAASLRTGYGMYTVDTGTYANDAYYPLTVESQSSGGSDARAAVLAIAATTGGGHVIAIVDDDTAYGLWALHLDLEFATATDGTVSAVELISHTGLDPSAGTVVATFHSNVSGDPGGYTSVRGTYMFKVNSVPAPNFSFRVDAASDQEFNVAGRRQSIYIAQLSRGAID